MTTLRQLIDRVEEQFIQGQLCYGHGAANALDEAAYLVLGALDAPFDADAVRLNEEVSAAAQARVEKLVAARISARKPVAYLLNKAWFAGLPFYVDERVLIPRSPLAELIQTGFSPWIEPEKVSRILDLGTGSGCIAIACAHAFEQASVDATDIDAGALEVARHNRDLYRLASRLRLVQSDLFDALDGNRYDIIISNPPYVPDEKMSALPAEYLHEPSQALAAGADGLDLVERILQDAHNYLTDQGILVVEVGQGQAALEAKYPRAPFVWLEFEHGGEGVFLLSKQNLGR